MKNMVKDPEKGRKSCAHCTCRVALIALAEFVYGNMCMCVRARSSPLYDRYVSTEQWLLCECDFQIFCITHTIRFLKNTLCLQCTHISQRASEARGRAHTHAGTQSHIKSKAQVQLLLQGFRSDSLQSSFLTRLKGRQEKCLSLRHSRPRDRHQPGIKISK